MKFNIAAAQIQSHQADPYSNLEEISKICQRKEIAAAPNTIVVFPELARLNKNLWVYQKGFLAIGGIFAILAAIIRSLIKLPLK